MMLTTSVTATTRVLAVLANTTMTEGHFALEKEVSHLNLSKQELRGACGSCEGGQSSSSG